MVILWYSTSLWTLHSGLVNPETNYMIAMVWDEPTPHGTNAMTDLWTHLLCNEYEEFGGLMDVLTFRNLDRYTPDQRKNPADGSESGNTIRLLAAEVEHRNASGDRDFYLVK